MQRNIPLDVVREEQELVPGGDLRKQGNAWLRAAWHESKVKRIPREGEIRKVIGQLANIHDICSSAALAKKQFLTSLMSQNLNLVP